MTKTECSLRALNCELNYLSVPDGSIIFLQGDTSVIAGIYGPIEAKLQKTFHNKASVEASFGPIKGPPSINDRLIELYLRDTSEGAILTMLHPASAITIHVQELQDCGGLLACGINASCLALINSGISMKYTYAAVCCMVEKETQNLIVDPDKNQLQNAKAVFTSVFDSINKELICCHTNGQFLENQFLQSVIKCKEASQYIFDFYRDTVKKYANII